MLIYTYLAPERPEKPKKYLYSLNRNLPLKNLLNSVYVAYWRRFVKNIDGQRVVIIGKNIGVSQLFGARARATPKGCPTKSTPMMLHLVVFSNKIAAH